ncbi:MFS transporter [bacterium]|nr:MFS transporter [bacterium]
MNSEECARKNVNLFLLFRVVFNARFYYPVLAILFLDLGLSLEQYSLLNVAWAASIVGLEVPSGVLADLWGRKKLVVLASVLMVVEMAIFAFAPTENIQLLFYLFFFNRILSGAAEAAASGADEALTYDALEKAGLEKTWPNVLEKLGRLQSIAFFVAMIVGAAVYDPSTFNIVGGWLGLDWNVQAQDVVRMPIYLTFLLSLVACFASFNMIDHSESDSEVSFGKATKEIIDAGKWILFSPIAFFVIFAYVCNDSVIRMFMTMTSQYYRVLELPEASFGVIGSVFALIGFISPTIAKRLIKLGSAQKSFAALSLSTLLFLALLPITTELWGLIFAAGLGLGMGITGFLVSHYLNEAAEPKKRATILSFKGLAGNLVYGGVGIFFAGLLKSLEQEMPGASENTIFMEAMGYLPWVFLGMIVLAYASAKIQNINCAR